VKKCECGAQPGTVHMRSCSEYAPIKPHQNCSCPMCEPTKQPEATNVVSIVTAESSDRLYENLREEYAAKCSELASARMLIDELEEKLKDAEAYAEHCEPKHKGIERREREHASLLELSQGELASVNARVQELEASRESALKDLGELIDLILTPAEGADSERPLPFDIRETAHSEGRLAAARKWWLRTVTFARAMSKDAAAERKAKEEALGMLGRIETQIGSDESSPARVLETLSWMVRDFLAAKPGET
jgi:DNA repair exonuclease SbcCD ATPase subunit